MLKKFIISLVALIILTANIQQAVYAYAIDENYRPINAPLDLPFKNTSGEKSEEASVLTTLFVLQLIAGALLYFAAPLAVFSVAQAAFKISMSGSSSEGLEQGKKHLTWAILGLLLIIFSYSLAKMGIGFIVGAGNSAAIPIQTQTQTTQPTTK